MKRILHALSLVARYVRLIALATSCIGAGVVTWAWWHSYGVVEDIQVELRTHVISILSYDGVVELEHTAEPSRGTSWKVTHASYEATVSMSAKIWIGGS
jgi:hypothetical protein